MSTITFDTLKFSERLKAAGVPAAQAVAEAEALRDVLGEALDTTLATKADIARLETRLDGLGKDMLSLENRLTIKLGALMAMAVGVIIAVLRMPG